MSECAWSDHAAIQAHRSHQTHVCTIRLYALFGVFVDSFIQLHAIRLGSLTSGPPAESQTKGSVVTVIVSFLRYVFPSFPSFHFACFVHDRVFLPVCFRYLFVWMNTLCPCLLSACLLQAVIKRVMEWTLKTGPALILNPGELGCFLLSPTVTSFFFCFSLCGCQLASQKWIHFC